MATVSVIVSVVLTGCSYGNNVCYRGLVQIKLFRCEMYDRSLRGYEGGTNTLTNERAHLDRSICAHGSIKMDRQSTGIIFLPPFPNKPVSTATILIEMERGNEMEEE